MVAFPDLARPCVCACASSVSFTRIVCRRIDASLSLSLSGCFLGVSSPFSLSLSLSFSVLRSVFSTAIIPLVVPLPLPPPSFDSPRPLHRNPFLLSSLLFSSPLPFSSRTPVLKLAKFRIRAHKNSHKEGRYCDRSTSAASKAPPLRSCSCSCSCVRREISRVTTTMMTTATTATTTMVVGVTMVMSTMMTDHRRRGRSLGVPLVPPLVRLVQAR